jgi:glycine cleavage system aminomethyltransferase T
VQILTGSALDPGQAAAIASGGLTGRIARDWAMALLRPSGEEATMKALTAATGSDVSVTDLTSAIAGFLVGGPRLGELLARTLTVDVAAFEAGRCIAASWARIPAVMVVRKLDATVVELYVGSEYGRYAWETLQRLGEALGGQPVGWRGLDALGWT